MFVICVIFYTISEISVLERLLLQIHIAENKFDEKFLNYSI